MKRFKIVVAILFGFLGFQTINAQDQAATKSKDDPKKTIKLTEKQEKVVKHKGITYYVIDGMWHTKMKNRYVLKAAPEGARTDFIPNGGKLVVLGGKKYYKCKGVFYQKAKEGYYEIARP